MNPVLKELLFRVAAPVAVIAVLFAVMRARGLDRREQLALRPPAGRWWWAWPLGWLAWVYGGDKLGEAIGVGNPAGDWAGRSALHLAITFVGMVLLFPAMEELVFRGVLFSRLRQTALGAAGAVLITAGLFAAAHLQYEPVAVAFILVDGLLLALARHFTGSVYVCIAMHALGNLYAYLERLP